MNVINPTKPPMQCLFLVGSFTVFVFQYLFLNNPTLISALHGDSACTRVKQSKREFIQMYLEVMFCHWSSTTYIFLTNQLS